MAIAGKPRPSSKTSGDQARTERFAQKVAAPGDWIRKKSQNSPFGCIIANQKLIVGEWYGGGMFA